MGEEHLNFLSQPHRDRILLGLSNVAGIGIWAEFYFRCTGLAGVLQRLVLSDAFTAWATVRIRVITAELLERLALRADVLVVLRVSFEVCTRPSTVGAPGFVQHGNVGIDLAVNELPKHRP